MGLVPKFTNADIEKMVRVKMERIEQVILLRLQRIGEQFITDARTNGSYTDRTGNLRSSIGYVVLRNGEQYSKGGFAPVKGSVAGPKTKAGRLDRRFKVNRGKLDVGQGEIKGKAALSEAIGRFPRGYVLIVVAGMSYAAAVESKGKDVLTGSSQTAVVSLKNAMETISKKVA
jgi:hypothetical protein